MREIKWAADGRQSENWAHTSELYAKLHNVNCADNKDMIKSEQINPFHRAKLTKPARVPFGKQIAALKPQFVKG